MAVLLRRFSLAPLLILLGVALAACDGGGEAGAPSGGVSADRTAAATATPEGPDLTVFRNFTMPIAGACLPSSDNLMPNAPREYRGGLHEGVDFYTVDNCTEIEKRTPVLAAKAGTVIRADVDYQPLTQAQLDAANERIANGGANDFEVLDLFRGRQVWIDHGKGIVTRYAHLSGIAPGITEGAAVRAGQVVAYAGDSGTPESLSAPDTELHLHWELRTGDTFLGAGLPAEEVRALYKQLFEPLP